MRFPWLVLAVMFGSSPPPDASPGASVEARIQGFLDAKGRAGCKLYSRPQGFPDAGNAVEQFVELDVPAAGGPGNVTATCVFTNLAPGTYALAVMHDQDGNGRLNKNFLGLPVEPFGVSNNHIPRFSPPGFGDASFPVAAGQAVHVTVTLHH